MKTKVCSHCKEEKPISEFYSQPKHKYGVMSICKKCFIQFCVQRWRNRKIKYIKLLGSKCQCCGVELNDTNFSIFDFHHVHPEEKEYTWAKLRLFSDARILQELAKCELLCANCHRLKHYEQ